MTHKGEHGMDTPEKIWAHCETYEDGDCFIEYLSDTPWPGDDGGTAYTRSDLYDALKAENERLREALGELEIMYKSGNWPPQSDPENEDYCPHGRYKERQHCWICEIEAIRALIAKYGETG